MPIPRHQRCMHFYVEMTLVTVITHWKWKNQNNNNDITSFDPNTNPMDDIDKDDNDEDNVTNEFINYNVKQ